METNELLIFLMSKNIIKFYSKIINAKKSTKTRFITLKHWNKVFSNNKNDFKNPTKVHTGATDLKSGFNDALISKIKRYLIHFFIWEKA